MATPAGSALLVVGRFFLFATGSVAKPVPKTQVFPLVVRIGGS